MQNLMSRVLRSILLLCLCASLAACWGDDDDGTPPPVTPPAASGSVAGIVVSSATGLPIAGVAVSAGGITATTTADGRYTLSGVAVAASTPVAFSLAGHAPSFATVDVIENATTPADVRLTPVAASLTFAANAGATVVVPASPAQVVLPADGLVVAGTGAAASGQVTADVTPINPALDPGNMPGNFSARSGTTAQTIESFGALNVSLRDAAGNRLNLAPGKTATLRIPLATLSSDTPATIPLYWFDESTGVWVEEGSATLGGTAPNQYYEGTVSHFTTWNCDRPTETIRVRGCVQDANGARLARVMVKSEGIDYSGSAVVSTDANGNFVLPMRKDGVANVVALLDARVSNAVSAGPSATDLTLPACLVLGNGAPVIVQHPTDQNAQAGAPVQFEVRAVGAAPLRYQWQRNGSDIVGATATIYGFTASPEDSGAQYRAVVRNDVGTATSGLATLTVTVPTAGAPEITQQPQSASAAVGQTASFTVAASGTAPLAYQWRRNGVAIAGATAATYTTPVLTLEDQGATFSVLVSNGVGSVASATATLSVTAALSITQQPQGVVGTVGQTATFSVVAAGTAPIAYQWRRNGSNIAGATQASYTTGVLTTADNGALFSVVVSNAAVSLTSADAPLTVGTGGAGYYLMAEAGASVDLAIVYANGSQTTDSRALLAVRAESPNGAITVEPAGAALRIFTQAIEATVAGGQVSNARERYSFYLKGGRAWRVDHRVTGTAPVPAMVSTLTPAQLCGSGGRPQSDYLADSNDYADPSKSWGFFKAPGPDGACDTGDDVNLAVQAGMSATDAPRSVSTVLAGVHGANGAITGFIVRSGNQVQRLDANLANPSNLFTLTGTGFQNHGVSYGSTLPGIWLFSDNGRLWGYNLGGNAGAATQLAALAAGEDSVQIASDGADAYALISTATASRVLKLTESLTSTAVLSLSGRAYSVESTPTRLVFLVQQGAGVSVGTVPKAGGTLAVVAATSQDDWTTSGLYTSGENIYFQQTKNLGTLNSTEMRVNIVSSDGSNLQTLSATGILGAAGATSVPYFSEGRLWYAIHLVGGLTIGQGFSGGTLRTVEGATRNALVTNGVLESPVPSLGYSFTPHYGVPALISLTPWVVGIDNPPIDLYHFDSDAVGVTRITNFNTAAPTAAPGSERARKLSAARHGTAAKQAQQAQRGLKQR
jgi:hypothetical protein